MEETRKDKIQLIVRRFFLIITDIILINGSVMLSLLMRFNVDYLAIEPQYIDSFSFCTVSQKLNGQTTTTQSTYAFTMLGNTISLNTYDTSNYMSGLYTGLHRVNLVNGKTGSPVNGSVFCTGMNYTSYSNHYKEKSIALCSI